MKKSTIIFALLALLFISLRFQSYEPIDRSVSNFDTQGYIQAGHIPFPSAKFFTSLRPATIALMYKLAEPPGGYAVTNLSSPGDFINPPLAVQPGLGAVTTVQSVIGALAWLSLAFVVFRILRHTWTKMLGAALVLLFALAPQMAEWDYVLMSESLSLSLFILLLALSLELSVRLAAGPKKLGRAENTLLGGWVVVAIFFVFARDTNAYLLPVLTVALLALFLARRKLKFTIPSRAILILAALLATLFIVTARLSQVRGLWINAFFNNLLEHVFSEPEHLAFFEARGLPATDEVLALKDSPYTQLKFFEIDYLLDWTKAHGAGTYIEFIATHPVWALQTVAFGTELSFAENNQPFFTRNEEVTPSWLVNLGELLHPKDMSVLLVVLVEFAVLGFLALRSADRHMQAVFACFAVFFVGELAMLAVSILGDASSVVRHTLGSLIPIRLSVWALAAFILDGLAYKRT